MCTTNYHQIEALLMMLQISYEFKLFVSEMENKDHKFAKHFANIQSCASHVLNLVF